MFSVAVWVAEEIHPYNGTGAKEGCENCVEFCAPKSVFFVICTNETARLILVNV